MWIIFDLASGSEYKVLCQRKEVQNRAVNCVAVNGIAINCAAHFYTMPCNLYCLCVHWVQIEAVRDIKGSNNIIAPVSQLQNFYHNDTGICMKRSIMDSWEMIKISR